MSKDKQYLEVILTLNPLIDASRIFELRQQFLNGSFNHEAPLYTDETAKPNQLECIDNPTNPFNQKKHKSGLQLESYTRFEIEEIIQQLYDNFWNLDEIDFKQKVEETKNAATDSPDICSRLERLLFLNTKRNELMPGSDPPTGYFDFYQEMANLLLLPPKQALDRKDWLIEQIDDIKNPHEILNGMNTIKNTHPDIYRLEFDYFESLYSMLFAKSQTTSNMSLGDLLQHSMKITAYILLAGFILLLIVMGLIFGFAKYSGS